MNVSLHGLGQLSDNVTRCSWHFVTHVTILWRPQVFQLLELPAETEKLETHQALLLTQRAILLQSIYNSSSDPGDNITAFKEVITDIWMGTKHPRHVILRNSLRRWHSTRRCAVRPPPPVLTSSVRSSPTTGITSSPASSPSPSWPLSVPLIKGNLEWVRTFVQVMVTLQWKHSRADFSVYFSELSESLSCCLSSRMSEEYSRESSNWPGTKTRRD